METILANGLSWLTKNSSTAAFFMFLMIGVIWTTVIITDFQHRLTDVEHICSDINNRQLPEIRAEIRTLNERVSKLEASMNERFLRIELQLNTIITTIETKEGKKPNFP